MDPNLPATDESKFPNDVSMFLECCQDAEEELPRKLPRSRGEPVATTAFADASHAADKVTWRSHSGHILFVNRAPVKWHSERQTTLETSAFSSEFIAMKHCIEDIECLRFKLRMFGIPLDEHKPETRILCDNVGVVKNPVSLFIVIVRTTWCNAWESHCCMNPGAWILVEFQSCGHGRWKMSSP